MKGSNQIVAAPKPLNHSTSTQCRFYIKLNFPFLNLNYTDQNQEVDYPKHINKNFKVEYARELLIVSFLDFALSISE